MDHLLHQAWVLTQVVVVMGSAMALPAIVRATAARRRRRLGLEVRRGH